MAKGTVYVNIYDSTNREFIDCGSMIGYEPETELKVGLRLVNLPGLKQAYIVKLHPTGSSDGVPNYNVYVSPERPKI